MLLLLLYMVSLSTSFCSMKEGQLDSFFFLLILWHEWQVVECRCTIITNIKSPTPPGNWCFQINKWHKRNKNDPKTSIGMWWPYAGWSFWCIEARDHADNVSAEKQWFSYKINQGRLNANTHQCRFINKNENIVCHCVVILCHVIASNCLIMVNLFLLYEVEEKERNWGYGGHNVLSARLSCQSKLPWQQTRSTRCISTRGGSELNCHTGTSNRTNLLSLPSCPLQRQNM